MVKLNIFPRFPVTARLDGVCVAELPIARPQCLCVLLRHDGVWAGPVDSPPCFRCSCERRGRSKWGNAGLLYGEGSGGGEKAILRAPFAATGEEGTLWTSVTRARQKRSE